MMINRSAIGAKGAPFDLWVERGKVMEFARAVRAQHPDHSAGLAPIAPPTFLTTQLFWEKLVEGGNPWALAGMSEERGMHAEQEYVFHGPPPRAGDRLIGQSTITEIWDKPSKNGVVLTFVKMVTTFHDADGRLVAEAILTGVERNPAPTEPAP
jgi:hypothetical protein